MSVAVNTSTPFLPITSLQLQHLQAVTHSFAQRRWTISSVFNNFRTLSVVMGGGTLSCQVFRGFRVGGFRSPLFSCRYKLFLLFRTICVAPRGVLQFDMPLRCTRTNVRLRRCFPVGKMRNSHVALSPFNAVYRHSMRGNTVRRKVWSHTANSGRLDAELLGAPRSSIAGYTCGRGAAQSHEQ